MDIETFQADFLLSLCIIIAISISGKNILLTNICRDTNKIFEIHSKSEVKEENLINCHWW